MQYAHKYMIEWEFNFIQIRRARIRASLTVRQFDWINFSTTIS